MILLHSKDIVSQKKTLLKEYFYDAFYVDKYLAIVYFGNDPVISVYVRNKTKFGVDVGLEAKLFGQDSEYDIDQAFACIRRLNEDTQCIGIILQLPLPSHLREHQQALCDSIDPRKDVDAMTSIMMGKIAIADQDAVYPAAVGASIQILKAFDLHHLRGKQISIIGQSNLVGKPFTLYCINQGAQVHSFGVDGSPDLLKSICKVSDYIISATGVVGLVDKDFVACEQGEILRRPLSGFQDSSGGQTGIKQVIIDIGYGLKDGKAVGDVNFEQVRDLVYAITPVPGGVGPLCVCQLFENVYELSKKSIL